MTMDGPGNLYGTTEYGGILNCDNGGVPGCGVAYKMRQQNSTWIFSVLHEFPGQNGFLPTSPGDITIGTNGAPYGTELLGGAASAGTVYELLPSFAVSAALNSPWSYHLIHTFGGGNDGGYPQPGLLSIRAETSLVRQGWVERSPALARCTRPAAFARLDRNHSLQLSGRRGTAIGPRGAALDEAGNIYGSTGSGGNQECENHVGCGTVYELTRSGSGWTKTILHVFEQTTDGGDPGPVARDSAGNLFGLTSRSGGQGRHHLEAVSCRQWLDVRSVYLPLADAAVCRAFRPVIDSAGALYGVTNGGGADNFGSAYKLAPSNGKWIYTDLHDFGSWSNQTDGCYPRGPVALDAAGNIYGAAQSCGGFGVGDVFRNHSVRDGRLDQDEPPEYFPASHPAK